MVSHKLGFLVAHVRLFRIREPTADSIQNTLRMDGTRTLLANAVNLSVKGTVTDLACTRDLLWSEIRELLPVFECVRIEDRLLVCLPVAVNTMAMGTGFLVFVFRISIIQT